MVKESVPAHLPAWNNVGRIGISIGCPQDIGKEFTCNKPLIIRAAGVDSGAYYLELSCSNGHAWTLKGLEKAVLERLH